MDTETTGSYEDEHGETFQEETGAEGQASNFILGGVGPDEPLPSGAGNDEEDGDDDDDGAEEEEARRSGKARGEELEQERALEAGLDYRIDALYLSTCGLCLAGCGEYRHRDEQHLEDPAEARDHYQEVDAAGHR